MKVKIIILVLTVFLTSCDPTYSISIINGSDKKKLVTLQPNDKFLTDKISIDVLENGMLTYELSTHEKINIGFSIGELQDDLPFDFIIFVDGKDTISTKNKDQLLKLFDQNILGKLLKPYNITIK